MKTIFHKILATTAICLAAVGLSSCSFVLQTHQKALDMAKEYDAIVVLHDAVYQAGNRFYVQGVQTKVRRSGRSPILSTSVLSSLATHPEITGEYTILPDAERKIVYYEFRLEYGKKPFDIAQPQPIASLDVDENNMPRNAAPTWIGGGNPRAKGWYPLRNNNGEIVEWYVPEIDSWHSRDYEDQWRETLPAGARPIRLTAEEIANHPVLKGESGVPRTLLRERGEARVNTSRALFAYPLAGICWVVPDAPVTVASHILDLPMWVLDWIWRA